MKVPDVYFTGFNGFHQFEQNNKLKADKFEKFDFKHDKEEDIQSLNIFSHWSYNAIYWNRTVQLTGTSTILLTYNANIKKISGTDSYCLILLQNGELYRYAIDTNENQKLNFLNIESIPIKRKKIFHDSLEQQSIEKDEIIVDIDCGSNTSVAVTNRNVIFVIPVKFYVFPKGVTIAKISCGNDFVVLLTKNGDVYFWGMASKGQSGNGETVKMIETPILVEPLAGIKIIDIATGGWHTIALSVFGDIYTWGWNTNGQLGHKQSMTNLATLVEDYVDRKDDDNDLKINRIFCGMRHSIFTTENGKLFGCGSNRYGQLGLSNVDQHSSLELKLEEECDEHLFREISLEEGMDINNYFLVCGKWSTILISK